MSTPYFYNHAARADIFIPKAIAEFLTDRQLEADEQLKETDRLRTINEQLLEALQDMVSDHECISEATLDFAREAIEAATGGDA